MKLTEWASIAEITGFEEHPQSCNRQRNDENPFNPDNASPALGREQGLRASITAFTVQPSRRLK
jgi:hypothetical protein